MRLIDQEQRGIDVNVMRFDHEPLANALVRAHQRGVPVRVNTESAEYRLPARPMVSFVLDTLYAAGVPLMWRAHYGNNHEKLGIFHAQQTVVRGSSNWSPGSDKGSTNIEFNLFSNPAAHPGDVEDYLYYARKFDRRWFNQQFAGGVRMIESKPFVPQGPGSVTYVSPANAATVAVAAPQLVFKVKWAHYVDVLYGRSASALTPHKSRMRVSPNSTVTVTLPALAAGTHYWRVVARTAANKTATGAIWSFRVP